ncbi:MAG: RagB/SusD family nutrient uptake outer membrane protein [Bacteroides sp.]|nr:RagB/SusD family nutrient uptake outer membrane protein [Bacteroides sp.]MCM1390656.1 RagB/SusD family nutrient uptake outer membrane protein [Bacteroides sp.]
MKTKIKSVLYGAAALLTGVCATSCDSFLEEYSQDLAKVNSWEDLDEVLLGSGYIHSGRFYVEHSSLQSDRDDNFDILHFMSDELVMTDDTYYLMEYYDDMFPFYTWQQDTGVDNQLRYEGNDEIYFNSPYNRINVCNMVISIIDDQPEPTENDVLQKRRVKGEAYFLRALYYFTLANLYCEPYNPATAASTPGMPLKFSEIIEDKEFLRSTLKETYEKVLEDLAEAERCLIGTTRKSIYHADLATVHLLQSRVYLYMQDWDNAIAKAREVLAENDKLLNIGSKAIGETCLDASSPEVLFSMGDYLIAFYFQDDRYNGVSVQISPDMLNLYSDDDFRAKGYIGTTDRRGRDIFRKVNGQKEAQGSYTSVGSTFTFRTAEAYMTLAEASAYKGDEATARSTMEKFLATRMASKTSVTQSGNELIDFIRDERAREFLLESHRWFDLRRYTVCNEYPWSKTIEHGYPYDSGYNYDHTDWYRLEKNDAAYTLPIPRKVLNFQISLGNISRPSRTQFATTKVHGPYYGSWDDGDDSDDDDNWGDDDDDDWWDDDDDW